MRTATAANVLGLGQRQVQRLVREVEANGAMAVRHKLRGRPSNNRISDLKRDYILSLIRSDYPDFGPTLAAEKLAERHGIRISSESLRQWMLAAGPAAVRAPLVGLVRSMNCYYSNLIEGHDTHPIDIERAMRQDFSADPVKRNLQLEALAHIEVQKWIDEGGLIGHPLDPDNLREIHRRFCDGLPEALLVQKRPNGEEIRIVPGAFRQGYVKVGPHVPPSPGAVPRMLAHMHRMYRMQGRIGIVLATACAHHRLVWVHPFSDMNGRVSRMVAHAMLRDTVKSEGLWSASRGLARNVEDYKARLAAADAKRPGGADGRGALSEARLAEFGRFFLQCCIDQVSFMSGLMRPAYLRSRIVDWAQREEKRGNVIKGSDRVLRAILMEGEVERGVVPNMLGVGDRQARKVTARLLELEALSSDSPKAPLRLHFPATLASVWMPNLFPER